MKGLLVYDAIGANRNRWFIEKLTDEFKKRNIDLTLAVVDNKNKINALCDFAIVRTIVPNINKALENSGVRVFNNFHTSFVANSKWETYLFAQKLGVPTMETYHGLDIDRFEKFPCVVKSCNGHGGKEVFWANNKKELSILKKHFECSNKDYIVQQPCSTLGKDMRIYVLGQKIVACMLRQNSSDFRSNYSLGGTAEQVVPHDYQVEIVKKIASELKSDYIGVDFICDNGNWVLNEIEDVVGARMLYNLTNIDIATEYANYIEKEMENKNF